MKTMVPVDQLSPLYYVPPITSFDGSRRYLSNPYRCPVLFEGIEYPGAEWAFQAAKSLDLAFRHRIAVMSEWREAKAAGRAIRLRPTWDTVKRQIMMKILLDKFTRNPGLGAALITTGSAVLVEGNTWGDWYWGAVPFNGTASEWQTNPPGLPIWQTESPYQILAGRNWLGWQLMMIRDLLRPED